MPKVPQNNANNFSTPSLAVKKAVAERYLFNGQRILEIGPGNLRNLFFLSQCHIGGILGALELAETKSKYHSKYNTFARRGGLILDSPGRGNMWDVVILTFVLEVVCPSYKRDLLLGITHRLLKKGGRLILSVRGGGDCRGQYRRCPIGEGWMTSLDTFVKPFTLKSLERTLRMNAFTNIRYLQTYRTNSPRSIHAIVEKGGS